jgi:hypothetical protein
VCVCVCVCVCVVAEAEKEGIAAPLARVRQDVC